jgi:imidazole glycerol phosphate synthase glutamine amidotransferase subunit
MLAREAADLDADLVVLPGVGTFGAAGAALDGAGWSDRLRARLAAGHPTLAVCVGMQLLAERSEESVGAVGLGMIEATVTRLPTGVRVPQLGWNQVIPQAGCRFLAGGWAYFAHSYRIGLAPAGWSVATTDYGGVFPAALEKGDVLACQFHPELSGGWGLELLRRWLEGTGS